VPAVTVVLEISVLMAQFPSKQIAQLSYEYRTWAWLCQYRRAADVVGIPYDSMPAARSAPLSSIMTGISTPPPPRCGAARGFPRLQEEREHMLRVMRNHRRAAYGEKTGYERVSQPPVRLDHAACPDTA